MFFTTTQQHVWRAVCALRKERTANDGVSARGSALAKNTCVCKIQEQLVVAAPETDLTESHQRVLAQHPAFPLGYYCCL